MDVQDDIEDQEGEELQHPKYPIYNANKICITSLHAAAQWGDRKYIMTTMEKCLDIDVNATVSTIR